MIPPDPPPFGHLSSASSLPPSASSQGASTQGAAGQSLSGQPDQQPELFETSPPPWELTNAEDLAMASVVFSEAPMVRMTIESPMRFGRS